MLANFRMIPIPVSKMEFREAKKIDIKLMLARIPCWSGVLQEKFSPKTQVQKANLGHPACTSRL
jgi:hypothetical protein